MKKEAWKLIGFVILVFFFGMALNLGHKTVDRLWPDEPAKIEVIHKAENGQEI